MFRTANSSLAGQPGRNSNISRRCLKQQSVTGNLGQVPVLMHGNHAQGEADGYADGRRDRWAHLQPQR